MKFSRPARVRISICGLQEDDIRRITADQTPMADPALGTGIRRPEDSVYYHPTINPSGVPPAGKPQRYRTSVLALEAPHAASSSAAALPVPKPPPLPKGPAPQLALPAPLSTSAAAGPSSRSHAEGKPAQLMLVSSLLLLRALAVVICSPA